MRPFLFYLHFIIFPLLLEVTAPNVHTVNRVEFATVDLFSQISLPAVSLNVITRAMYGGIFRVWRSLQSISLVFIFTFIPCHIMFRSKMGEVYLLPDFKAHAACIYLNGKMLPARSGRGVAGWRVRPLGKSHPCEWANPLGFYGRVPGKGDRCLPTPFRAASDQEI